MAALTEAQSKQFIDSIVAEIREADGFAKSNQRYDIAFRIIVLLMGLGIVVSSGVSAADIYPEKSKLLSAISAILGGALATVSAFAFEQFNFSKRWSTFVAKASAFKSLRDEIVLNPDAQTFYERLAQVRSWNETNPPTQLSPPKPAAEPPKGEDA